MKMIVLTVALIAAGTMISGSAFAQQGVINLDETVIKGRIEKPEAFYILQHAQLNYEKLKPKQSFIPELLETVDEKPF
ncbi:hypothetical protein FRD01_17820 [Microvenator marinus]|jgi:hypothetical protein|uniref:Peptidylprolyl isomerase n=1 Tax=Microvenator marinus TaxID=2600177 RepID=A0A5B8XT32_9DELT|nr:hypothetical protein [Microvenator marinus]QED29062.1 hypothetical protein FRD01_17820 [Microvenator marinus]